MCRCRGLVRRFASGRDSRKVSMSTATVAEKSEVSEFNVSEDSPQDDLPETTTETSARKRGRPRLEPEVVSPLEQAEKRMKTAKAAHEKAQWALVNKVINLHATHAFYDHASVVARHHERLENLAKGVVELQLEAEAAERSWQCERSKAKLATCEQVLALTQRAGAFEDAV